MFCFLILSMHDRNSLSPCFANDTTALEINKKLFSDPIFTQKFMRDSFPRKSTYFVAEPDLISAFEIPLS